MQDIKLRAASEQDLGTITGLARTVWNQHYPGIITQQQIDYMLGRMYSPESLRSQMTEQGHQFFLILLGGKETGFLSVSPEDGQTWFLNKFYIDQHVAGQGLGTRALEAIITLLRPSVMRLTVNRQNFKSVNFYFKNGFRIERVADFDIGEGYVMNDFVMIWEQERKG